MARARLVLLSFLLLLVGFHGPAYARLRAPRVVLENGLEVVVLEEHSLPLVTVAMALRAGASVQPAEWSGLAHFLEHMVFEKAEAGGSSLTLRERLRRIGADYNGTTSGDMVYYRVTVQRDGAEEALRALQAAVLTPRIDVATVERERKVVLDEWDRDASHPFERFEMKILDALWGRQVSRRSAMGRRNVVERATAAELRAIHGTFYVPNQALLAISGDVDFGAMVRLSRSLFSGWARGGASQTLAFDELRRDEVVVEESDAGDVMFVLSLRGPDLYQDPRGAFAGMLLGGMASVRESSFLRRLSKAADWMTSSFSAEPYRTLGTIRAECDVRAEDAKGAIEAWVRELSSLTQPDYFLEDELRLAKRAFIATRAFSRETTSERAAEIAMWWRLADFGRYKTYENDVLDVRSLDITTFARKYLERKPLVLAVVGPKAALAEHGLTRADLVPWLAKIRADTGKAK